MTQRRRAALGPGSRKGLHLTFARGVRAMAECGGSRAPQNRQSVVLNRSAVGVACAYAQQTNGEGSRETQTRSPRPEHQPPGADLGLDAALSIAEGLCGLSGLDGRLAGKHEGRRRMTISSTPVERRRLFRVSLKRLLPGPWRATDPASPSGLAPCCARPSRGGSDRERASP